MKPIKIAWNKYAATPLSHDLAQVLDEPTRAAFTAKVNAAVHPAYQLSADLFVEIPAPGWGHGDLLVYLPKRGWLVRRNYQEYWYVDLGLFRQVGEGLFGWTDLWLDVVAPAEAHTYRLLDVDEFSAALRDGQISRELASYATMNLHALLDAFHRGQFPPPEVREAEAFAAHLARND